MVFDDKLVTKANELVGGVRLQKIVDVMLNNKVRYARVAGNVIRIRGDEIVVRSTKRSDVMNDFVRRLYRGERVLIFDHANVLEADERDVTLSISVPGPQGPVPLRFVVVNDFGTDDLVDLNEYFSKAYVLYVGKFKYVKRKRGRGHLEATTVPDVVELTVNDLPVHELVALFLASGFRDGENEKRIRHTYAHGYRDRIIGLELARRFGRFGPAMVVQISQPGYGKSSFYNRLRHYDNVSIFPVPPGKAILYNDERTRPPTPGRIYIDDVVVFDEVGDRDRSRHTEKASLIWPEIKAMITSKSIARIAVLGNVFTARGKPLVSKTMTVTQALANVFTKIGIRQLEGWVDRMVITMTSRNDVESLHGKRSRSEYVLDPVYYRYIRDKLVVDVRLWDYTYEILRRRLSGIVDDDVLTLAYNPFKYSSTVTVYEHMEAIERVGASIRKRLDDYVTDSVTISEPEKYKEETPTKPESESEEEPEHVDESEYESISKEEPTEPKDEIENVEPKEENENVSERWNFDDVDEDEVLVFLD